MSSQETLAITGVHHFKLPVSDLPRALSFYGELLGAAPIPALEHKHKDSGATYAHICDVPGLGTRLELRLNPQQAEKQRHWDPVTIAVTDREMLRRWARRLDDLGINRSGEIVAVQAWLVTFDDPDGNRLRFYTLETHGPELSPDEGNEWLRN